MAIDQGRSFLEKVVGNYKAAIIISIGGFVIVFETIDIIIDAAQGHFDIHNQTELMKVGLVLLALILSAIGHENVELRERVVEKLKFLEGSNDSLHEVAKSNFEALVRLELKDFQIIEGKESITDETSKYVKEANTKIRATSFHIDTSHKGVLGADNIDSDYHTQLGLLLKDKGKDIEYHCCYNSGHNFSDRKDVFKSLNLGHKEYAKMIYYQFDNQLYFDFLLIDHKVVFLAFAKSSNNIHMNMALKLTASSESNKKLIEGLANWYDSILERKGKQIADSRILIETGREIF